jgi:hypothetical protein
MRSLVQIQAGPHPESPVPKGFSAISGPRNKCSIDCRGQTRGQTCQATAKRDNLDGELSVPLQASRALTSQMCRNALVRLLDAVGELSLVLVRVEIAEGPLHKAKR